MSRTHTKALTVLAPAKVNLYLHVTGRRDDGFHELDSLFVFADIGDVITIQSAPDFSFTIDGPYSRAFTAQEYDAGPSSRNLAVRAARALAQAIGRDLEISIRLTKNLPLAAGIGGGSADAAAVIWGLLEYWNIAPVSVSELDDILLALGADVPACLMCEPLFISGAGEKMKLADMVPEFHAVLVNPAKHCPTAEVFARLQGRFGPPAPEAGEDFTTFLKEQRNDLVEAACEIVPEIKKVLSTIEMQTGNVFARMSGSGSTCFGIFESAAEALGAVEEIKNKNPEWWVRGTVLNRVRRY